MIRDRLQPVPLVLLTVVWILLWGNISWANALGGMALSTLVLLIFPLPRLVTGIRVRAWPLVVLISVFHRDLFVASAQVALAAFFHGPGTHGRLVSVRLRSPDEQLQTITAEMVALVPGTVVIDLNSASRMLLVHALGVEDEPGAEVVRRSILAQEDRVLRALAVDPSCGANSIVPQEDS
ncbi:Na+/H+ antiporter subunit E [Demetria terragena]|uniref:Na+/H+ antiporter subunit E n=1 Tax=Demetria terragena TaxID=63959 RepID=UPI00035CCF06|nr:Na+/H+ antiporter subunit E [Demetria terragena]